MDECTEETYSWWHFTPEQLDPYWIRCTLVIPHDVHQDEHTGLTWTGVKIRNDPEQAGTIWNGA